MALSSAFWPAAATHDDEHHRPVTADVPSAGTTTYRVPSGSMEPTLKLGSRVTVVDGTPKVGEHRRFPPARRRRRGEVRCGFRSRGSLPPARRTGVGGEVREAVVAGPAIRLHPRRPRLPQGGRHEHIRPRERLVHPRMRRQPGVHLLEADHDPRGLLVHGGRQPRRIDDSRFWGPVPTEWILGVVQGH